MKYFFQCKRIAGLIGVFGTCLEVRSRFKSHFEVWSHKTTNGPIGKSEKNF